MFFIYLKPSSNTCSRDYPRRSPRDPRSQIARFPPGFRPLISTLVFSGLRKKAEDLLAFNFIFSLLSCQWKGSGQVRQTYLREDIFVILTLAIAAGSSSQLCPAVATEVRMLLYRRMSDTDLHRGRTQGARQAHTHTRLFWPCIWSLLTSHGTSFLLIFPDFTSKKVTLNSLLISKSMGLVWPIFSISDPCQN